ncbi:MULTISPECIES: hypothetical protein [unclassified Arthrobacter]|uniref:hypothetical protein n=1 Tax=unclassified Arthrobacter TaxID=235627 RepID=UPI001E4C0DDD|nr:MULTISPECIES: hypothetical protein [unclassified Arthrobacter]MCC9146151.1 hypothetical protein [Arthrobacter sp. zg-Y919]MDK1277381.1 hypothetical protein [Arthrobacter sp. zg.Y919]WIB03878.1 hypothetical protein QNO10_04200 [Arthrobacter sp. zg-Y919]
MPFPGRAKQWLTAGAVGVAAAAITFAGSPAAVAAGSYLTFSPDGSTYSPTLDGPVFAESARLVPGGSTGGSVWIRNDGADAAYLSAGAVSAGMDPELVGMLSVSASAGAVGGPPAVLGSNGMCSDVYQGWVLGAGDAVRIQLTAGLSPDAPNAAMGRSARFDVVFYLQSTNIAGTGPSACEALGILDASVPPSDPGVAAGNGPGNDARTTGRQAPAPRPGSGTVPGLAPAGDGGAAALAGFPTAPAAPGEEDRNAAFNTNVPPVAAGRLEESSPASFESTVEPVIRSLSGTLLIALSVAFFATAGIRLRSRSR